MSTGRDHPGGSQCGEMLGDGDLGFAEDFLQMADTERRRGEQVQDSKSCLVAQTFVNSEQLHRSKYSSFCIYVNAYPAGKNERPPPLPALTFRMIASARQAPHRARDAREDLLAVLIWLCTLALFWGSARWIADQALNFQQVGHALLTLGLAAALILREHPDRPRPEWAFNRLARNALLAAYLLAAAALVLHQPLLFLGALSLVVGAALLFIWSPAVYRPAFAIASALTVLLTLAVLRPGFDWPLRSLAGSHAGWILKLLGVDARLGIAGGGEPELLLSVAGRLFVVAPECNGFGIISGAVLVAVLLAFLRPLRWYDKLLALVVAAFLGFAFNVLRIFVIASLASRVGTHYHLLHEVVGNAAVLASLAATWWIVRGLPAKPAR